MAKPSKTLIISKQQLTSEADELQQPRRSWHSDRLFKINETLSLAVSARDYTKALDQVRRGLKHLHGFVDESLNEFGLHRGDALPFPAVPLLWEGGKLCALMNEEVLLKEMQMRVEEHPSMMEWRVTMLEHGKLRLLFRDLERLITAMPGVRQDELKEWVEAKDGRALSTAVTWLEKAGRIERRKIGKTWSLHPAPPGGVKKKIAKEVPSHRTTTTKEAHRVRWQNVPYHPLPPPPDLWNTPDESPCDVNVRVEGTGWSLLESRHLVKGVDFDPAFRRCFAVAEGVLVLDDLGKTVEGAPAVLMRCTGDGSVHRHTVLEHHAYREEVRYTTGYFVALSKQQVLHVYDTKLERVLETKLTSAPEVLRQQKRFRVAAEALHRHLRSISVDDEQRCYLITIQDEAWCIGFDGEVRWGLRFPKHIMKAQEVNFERGTDGQWQDALTLLELNTPFTPDDAKRAYRRQALRLHPDVNPSPEATQQMQRLNEAMATVTGQGHEVASDESAMTWKISFGPQSTEDWVYACTFAEQSLRCYVATYSGKVLEVDEQGQPVRCFDSARMPTTLLATGGRLYLLVVRRLYVLEGERLLTLVDAERDSRLMLTDSGFLLISKHQVIGYNEAGERQGRVHCHAPILRVFLERNVIIVETKNERFRVTARFVGKQLIQGTDLIVA